ncbi:hypothetical protein PYCCODRAFT_1486914 [Trametes coccinea BRFM310]|uniref:Uncharacterized protein n=1 Tax=Trametes coccinea (strain BRFM310) TaxID=1353009 RepID=A0A1Y2I791_TRAC3|nr:hypothetical protein PYCCODRAFT_1486914 [Trametes coccinea BRFM310]
MVLDPLYLRRCLQPKARAEHPFWIFGSLERGTTHSGPLRHKHLCPSGYSSFTQMAENLMMSSQSDADADLDPLSTILSEQTISYAPQCYRLKLVDASTPTAESADSTVLDSFFSFTASPVQSPSYATTTFHGRQLHRPTPLSIPLISTSQVSPTSPNVVIREFGNGDKVDRWFHSGGLEPVQTPMLVEDSPHEFWDDGGDSDWREVIDHFLQYGDSDLDDPHFPRTPDGNVEDGDSPGNFVDF